MLRVGVRFFHADTQLAAITEITAFSIVVSYSRDEENGRDYV